MSSDTQKCAMSDLLATVKRLRAPDGCPWDREQTHLSLRPFLIEETYEVLDVLDQIEHDSDLKSKPELAAHFKEELGDLLMQVTLHAEMADQQNLFNFSDVAAGLNEKLVRRHPHVFGSAEANTSEQVLTNWEKIKLQEKKTLPRSENPEDTSVLAKIPKALPGLHRASKVIDKVSRVGFQWPKDDLTGPIQKLDEETTELKTELAALKQAKGTAQESEIKARVEHEIGDLLFCVANLAYLTGVQPEDALRAQLARFESRFRFVETELAKQGQTPAQSTLAQMDDLWEQAKRREKT